MNKLIINFIYVGIITYKNKEIFVKDYLFEKIINTDMIPNINENIKINNNIFLVKNKILDLDKNIVNIEIKKVDSINLENYTTETLDSKLIKNVFEISKNNLINYEWKFILETIKIDELENTLEVIKN